MTQQERQQRSQQMILEAALAEFGTHTFDAVSVNSICAKHHISKGLLYHYYPGKDALFLLCVGETFTQLNAYLRAHVQCDPQDVSGGLQRFFLARQTFFAQHPQHRQVFENAVFHAPAHLKEEIARLRAPLRATNCRIISGIINQTVLRPSLEAQEAFAYFESVECLFWTLLETYQHQAHAGAAEDFEQTAKKLLDMVLFGIARQN
nr:TetR/AcrR family transcriptional regulator [Maliibacterium massiliense]